MTTTDHKVTGAAKIEIPGAEQVVIERTEKAALPELEVLKERAKVSQSLNFVVNKSSARIRRAEERIPTDEETISRSIDDILRTAELRVRLIESRGRDA